MFIKVIDKGYDRALIEWVEGGVPQRGFIPIEMLTGNMIPDNALSLAVPYGVDWAFELQGAIGNVTPDVIAKLLRSTGIWTLQDALKNPNAVLGALQQAYGIDLQVILRLAKESL